MGDLQVGEAFKDKAFIIETATGNAWLLQAPTCTIIDESGNRAVGVVAEESNGWYTCTFTPDAAGTWCTEWALAASTIYSAYKEFKVGGGEVTDIKTETALVYADTNELQADWVNGGRLDVILDVAQGNTTSILAATDVATSTRLAATDIAVSAQNAAANVDVVDVVGNKTDTTAGTSLVSLIKIETAAIAVIDEFHDVPAQNAAANAQINEVIGNKTDTTAGDSLVALSKQALADTIYIADGALPAAPTAGSLGSRFTGMVVLETTIGPNNRSTTSCELVAGDTHNDTYKNMLVVLDNNENNKNYVSRTITAYTGASKTVTWTPALTHDAVDGGKIWIVANDTKLNVTCDAIKARTDRNEIVKTFFSPCQIEVVADTSHTDANLPTVTLPNISGTITHVYAGFKFRMIENTNAAVNKLSGAQEIQVDTVDAINFVDDQFGLAASTREGGDCIIGTVDLVATVDVFNHAYAFVWDEPLTDQDALHFNDVQTFLIVSYY